MRKLFGTFLASVAAIAVMLGLSAAPALAYPYNCNPDYICFYDNVGQQEPSDTYSAQTPRNTCKPVFPNNATSYIKNNTGVRWLVFQDDGANCGSQYEPTPGIIYPYSQGAMNTYNNDRISYTMRTSSTSKAGPMAVRDLSTGKLTYV